MSLIARFTKNDTNESAAQPSLRRYFAKLAAPALLALTIAGAAMFPQGQVQAAMNQQALKPDLDVVTCYAVDDPVNYGDGIDWYKIEVTYKNKGTAASGSFKYLVRPSWGVDLFSGQLGNEAYVIHDQSSLAPGQSVSRFYWVTKKVVDQRTWGIFLDNNGFNQGTVSELVETNNHCTAFVNP
jgi:hypothetical protein